MSKHSIIVSESHAVLVRSVELVHDGSVRDCPSCSPGLARETVPIMYRITEGCGWLMGIAMVLFVAWLIWGRPLEGHINERQPNSPLPSPCTAGALPCTALSSLLEVEAWYSPPPRRVTRGVTRRG